MNAPLFKDQRSGPDCPSELRFERWQLGELAPADQAALDAHASGCPHCEARLAERRSLLENISPAERNRMLRHILGAGAAAKAPAPWWRRIFGDWGLSPAFAAAAALVVGVVYVGNRAGPSSDEADILRTKGSMSLSVYRERSGEVEIARSGERMQKGDRLRFGIEVPKAGHIMIVGVEAEGSYYVCHPASGSGRSSEVAAGRTEALPGAIELDDSIGRESLHLVHCPEAFTLDDVTPIDSARLAERGCQQTPFEISKEHP